MGKHVALVVLLMLSATALLAPSASAYRNDEYGFSITPPEGWLEREEDTEAAVVMFTDSFVAFTGASVNVVVDETSKSLSEVVAQGKQEMNSSLEGYQLVSEGTRVIGNVNCYEIVYTWNYSIVAMKSKQVFAVEDGKTFLLSCASLAEQYEHSNPDFESCLESFRIEDTSQTGAPFNTTLIILIAVAVVAAVLAVAVVAFMPRKKRRRR